MYLKDKKLMPPPWLAYPEIERYSIGWRMGYGEDYIGRFFLLAGRPFFGGTGQLCIPTAVWSNS